MRLRATICSSTDSIRTLILGVAIAGVLGLSSVASAGQNAPEESSRTAMEWLSLGNMILTPLIMVAIAVFGVWKLPPSPKIAAWRIPLEIGALVFGSSILLSGIGQQYAIQKFATDDPVTLQGIATLGNYIGALLPLIVMAFLWNQFPKPIGAERSETALRSLGIGVIAILAMLPIIEGVGSLGVLIQERLQGSSPDPVAHQTLKLLTQSPIEGWWWMIAGGAIILAPIVEEILYRGIVQQSLRRLKVPRWWAILATSAGFTLMHIPVLNDDAMISSLVMLMFASMSFGWIRERTGLMAPSILAHMLFNAINVLLAITMTA